jgi:DNA-binding MarR family transcriptional regulator
MSSEALVAVNELLGSASILSSTVSELLEIELLEVTGGELTPSQLKILTLVSRNQAPRIGDVAGLLGVSNSAASKAVDRLVRGGLLRRTEVAADRRALEITLTARGRKILDDYERAADRRLMALFDGIPSADLRELAGAMDLLTLGLLDETSEGESCFRCGLYFREKCVLRRWRHKPCVLDLRSAGGGAPQAAENDENAEALTGRPTQGAP